jgi:hypothetical protein
MIPGFDNANQFDSPFVRVHHMRQQRYNDVCACFKQSYVNLTCGFLLSQARARERESSGVSSGLILIMLVLFGSLFMGSMESEPRFSLTKQGCAVLVDSCCGLVHTISTQIVSHGD